MNLLKTLVAAVLLMASPAFAAEDPENVLVIKVAGENSGTIELLLRPDVAPGHVARIKELARAGKYNGVVFHRVIDGFMAQTGDVQFGKRGGDLNRAGMGGSDKPDLKAEFSKLSFDTGVVGMARSSNPDSANSQFFIMFEPGTFLDGQYTVVGRVINGMDVVHKIKKGSQADNGSVTDPDYMEAVSVKADK
jgi:peptidylprolyl isomerase